MKYKHTNLVAHDWAALTRFYEEVFECRRVPPERHLKGEWLDRGTGVRNAELAGVHLRLPGYGDDGPTLEIFSYRTSQSKPEPSADREGYGHIAFEVDSVRAKIEEVLEHGGRKVGKVVTRRIDDVGTLTFVYVADPEGNILELQSWD